MKGFEALGGLLSVRGAKRMALSPGGLPLPELVMVVRDHTTPDLTAAFFNESMRRDAIIGERIAQALWDTINRCQSSILRQGEKELTSRARVECYPENTHTVSIT